MTQHTRPVAIINDGSFYVGPPLARALAADSWDMGGNDHSQEQFVDRRWPHYTRQARAVLMALREPSVEDINLCLCEPTAHALKWYKAMIDHILNDGEPK